MASTKWVIDSTANDEPGQRVPHGSPSFLVQDHEYCWMAVQGRQHYLFENALKEDSLSIDDTSNWNNISSTIEEIKKNQRLMLIK